MKINITKSAKKDINKLDDETKRRITKEIRLLREGKTRIATLSGYKNNGKVRVGEYRIRYEIDRKNKIITITEIILRKDAYRDL